VNFVSFLCFGFIVSDVGENTQGEYFINSRSPPYEPKYLIMYFKFILCVILRGCILAHFYDLEFDMHFRTM